MVLLIHFGTVQQSQIDRCCQDSKLILNHSMYLDNVKDSLSDFIS